MKNKITPLFVAPLLLSGCVSSPSVDTSSYEYHVELKCELGEMKIVQAIVNNGAEEISVDKNRLPWANGKFSGEFSIKSVDEIGVDSAYVRWPMESHTLRISPHGREEVKADLYKMFPWLLEDKRSAFLLSWRQRNPFDEGKFSLGVIPLDRPFCKN